MRKGMSALMRIVVIVMVLLVASAIVLGVFGTQISKGTDAFDTQWENNEERADEIGNPDEPGEGTNEGSSGEGTDSEGNTFEISWNKINLSEGEEDPNIEVGAEAEYVSGENDSGDFSFDGDQELAVLVYYEGEGEWNNLFTVEGGSTSDCNSGQKCSLSANSDVPEVKVFNKVAQKEGQQMKLVLREQESSGNDSEEESWNEIASLKAECDLSNPSEYYGNGEPMDCSASSKNTSTQSSACETSADETTEESLTYSCKSS